MNWFDVDKEGLSKLLKRRGLAFVLYELFQNAWDTDATEIHATLEMLEGRPLARLIVEDDHPEGFKSLSHAWTLFAESEKKGDPNKRGRFNLGEKLVLACCKTAEIITTTGGVRFDDEGRHTLRKKRPDGSVFIAEIRMTRAEYEEVCAAVRTLIVPPMKRTTFNGEELPSRERIGIELASLPTEIADEEGYLRRRQRNTELHMYPVNEGETAHLYEMGIPVMETGDKYHVDVQQKIPLNLDRDGVHPSYLRAVRAATLNTTYKFLTKEESTAPWVSDAISSKEITPFAITKVLDQRFGEKRVIFDPSDPEGTKIAVTKGYTVISGGTLSSEQWENVKRFDAALPAGQVTPSPKPFHPGGKPLTMLEEWTPAVSDAVAFAINLFCNLIRGNLQVKVANDPGWSTIACYDKETGLTLNYVFLGDAIENRNAEGLIDVLLHEFSHHKVSDHLSNEFHEECCRLGARLAILAAERPSLVKL